MTWPMQGWHATVDGWSTTENWLKWCGCETTVFFVTVAEHCTVHGAFRVHGNASGACNQCQWLYGWNGDEKTPLAGHVLQSGWGMDRKPTWNSRYKTGLPWREVWHGRALHDGGNRWVGPSSKKNGMVMMSPITTCLNGYRNKRW